MDEDAEEDEEEARGGHGKNKVPGFSFTKPSPPQLCAERGEQLRADQQGAEQNHLQVETEGAELGKAPFDAKRLEAVAAKIVGALLLLVGVLM